MSTGMTSTSTNQFLEFNAVPEPWSDSFVNVNDSMFNRCLGPNAMDLEFLGINTGATSSLGTDAF